MKKTKLHITLLFSLIWSFSSIAQQYTNYNANNGLPSNHVYRITQDVEGFIWIITDKGMVKFNGNDFKIYNIRKGLPTNDIWNIITAPDGKVWFFSKSPKIGYIKNDSIYAFPSEIKGEILNPMNRNIVGNTITFNNSQAHYELVNNQWKKDTVFGSLSKLKQYKTFLKHPILDRYQFGKDKKQIIFYNNKNQEVKRLKNSKSIELSHTRAQVNDSTYIWLSDEDYTVLNLNTFQVKTTSFKDAIQIEKSKYVRIHKVNNQLQITGVGFVSALDKNYNLTNTHYIPKDLKAHFSFIDKQDNLWMATLTNGVYKFPNARQQATYSLFNDKVGKIKKIKNRLLTTVFNKGFYQYDSISKQFTPFIKEKEYSYGVFYIPQLDKTYFIFSNRITIFDGAKKAVIKGLKSHSYFNEIARQLVYHNHFLYGNFTVGLNKINTNDLSIEKEYLTNGIRTLASFKKKLIIATSNGLKILKNDSIQFLKIKNMPLYLNQKPILSLHKLDENSLLVGTDSYGAFITNLEKIIPLEETKYLSINDSFVKDNDLWLATDNGVLHYIKDTKNNYKYKDTYNVSDGLLVNNIRSVYATKNNLIVSSNNGAVTIPKKKSDKNQFITVYFENIKYNNAILNKTVDYKKNNQLQVKVSEIDFSENTHFNFEYQLNPLQNKWTKSTSNHLIFNDLPPNKYTLKIKSHQIKKSFNFKIKPLWYQQITIKIIFGLMALSAIIGLLLFLRRKEIEKHQKKINHQKKLAEFELHALRSQMNPHFVFNSLNAIQYYISKNETELSEKYLVKFSRLIRMFFDFSREKEITLNDEIKLLKGYLEIEQMRFGKDFHFRFFIDERLDIHQQKIPAMLLQPIVENAVNHGIFHNAGKGTISIKFNFLAKNSFEVLIADDGVGIKKSKEIQQQSLKTKLSATKTRSTQVLQERLYLLNQHKIWEVSYAIKDNEMEGTTVQLTLTKNETDKSYFN